MVSINGYHHAFPVTQPPRTPSRRTYFPAYFTASSATPHRSSGNKVSSKAPPKKPSGGIFRPGREAALSDIQKSSDLGNALASSGKILKVAELNLILRNFGSSSRWKDVSELFEWMLKHGKINSASYSSYIKFMAMSRNTSKALYAYKSINDEALRNNVSICNSILSCLVKNNNFNEAVNLFEQMKQTGLQPDVITYSTLLTGCMKVKQGYAKASELVKEMQSYEILMDSVIYGTLIAVCASNYQYKQAEMYYTQMKADGHSPNLYHYSALLNAYSLEGDCQKADELIQDMKSAGLVPNKVVLTTLLKVYVKAGLFDKSRLLLSNLQALGHAGDERPYCILMDGFSKSGMLDEAKAIFEEMNNRQVRSDGYSHSIMISALSSSGQLEEAMKWAADYEAKYEKYDVVILNAMLCAYCRAGDVESVMQTMRKMDKLALTPDQNTFHILIKYFHKEKLYPLAYRTLQDMWSKGYQLDEDILSSLVVELGKSGAHSEAFSAYNITKSNGRAISKTLHEKMLNILVEAQLLKDAYVVVKENANLISLQAVTKFSVAYVKSSDINSINDTLKEMHSFGCKIDQNVFQLAISRYIAQPEKELLLQLLQWMPVHGYVVNSRTRNLLLKNSDLFGHLLIAEMLSKQHVIAKSC